MGVLPWPPIARHHYDIVLLDVHMPELDGIEVVRQLGTMVAPRRPWVVGLTADAGAEERERCLAAGMDDFLTKPLKRAALIAAIERARAGIGRASASQAGIGPARLGRRIGTWASRHRLSRSIHGKASLSHASQS